MEKNLLTHQICVPNCMFLETNSEKIYKIPKICDFFNDEIRIKAPCKIQFFKKTQHFHSKMLKYVAVIFKYFFLAKMQAGAGNLNIT